MSIVIIFVQTKYNIMPTIYKLINPLNNEVYYIGYTERNIEDRLKDHLQTPKHETTRNLIKG